MKDDIEITVIFNPELIDQKKKETKKNIYSKHSDEKNKNKLAEKLEKKAAEDSVRFQKRKLSSLFNPVFSCCILFSEFSGKKTLDESRLIHFTDSFIERLEKDYAIHIINYSLKDGGDLNFFEFEIFNYNFDEHKAVKSEFVRPRNIKKIAEIAESVLEKSGNKKNKNSVKSVGKSNSHIIKSQETNEEEFAPGLSAEREICEIFAEESKESIDKQVGKISLSWSLLSPAENIPVLEIGDPVEIFQKSIVRIYFQKPNVRQVVWRFREKAGIESSRPMLRVYEGDDMLWYETLEGLSGSRYIIFPEGLELSSTWVEIGYLTDKGKFIFIARSPVWPPSCLFKKLPKLNLERKLPKEIRSIGLGATENLSGGNRGGGLSSSGAGIK